MGQAVRGVVNDRGSVLFMILPALLGLILMSAIVINYGIIELNRTKLQNLVDAAALAGAQQLPVSSGQAVEAARANASSNGGFGETTAVTIENNGEGIRVRSTLDIPVLFGSAIGKPKVTVTANAKAVLKGVGSMTGIRPFAVEDRPFIYNAEYTLMAAPADASGGNFGAVALGGNGADTYRWNIIFGYQGELRVGQWISTEPGRMLGPTERGVEALIANDPHSGPCTFNPPQPDCTRVIKVIVIGTEELDGRTWVQIRGFALFYLESVSGQGSECELTGRFLETVLTSSSVGPDYGVQTAVLEE